MKKLRGLLLGRKLVRIYKRLLCRRCRPRRASYIRLGAASSFRPPATTSSALYAYSTHHSNGIKQATLTSKLFCWGRKLCQRPFPTRGWFQRQRPGVPRGEAEGEGRYNRRDSCAASTPKMLSFDHHPRLKHQKLEHQPYKPPKGHLVVYVGKGGSDGGPPPHRVVVPVIYFNHPLFGDLLREAEQEYGFEHGGGITIPCPISDFETIRDRVAAADLHIRTSSGRSWRWH